jgi:DNA repair photolyase
VIKEIVAKTLLSSVTRPDSLFGLKYNMNLYRGCQHQCIYCDSRSECYQIENFNQDVLVKANSVELLRKELAGKRVVGTIGTGSMNDPYMPLEAEKQLTRHALETIAEFHFPVHIITKNDLVLRDLDLLKQISQTYAAVTFTVTTADDNLSKKLEPGASVSSRRLAAMRRLSENGILTGLAMMPILPFIEDNEENISRIVTLAHENGAAYILPAFGVTLRDRQRAYFYDKLDQRFPGLRIRYNRAFGERYFAPVQNHDRLEKAFTGLCRQHGIATKMPVFSPQKRIHAASNQPSLF